MDELPPPDDLAAWRARLSPQVFSVTRLGGTEPPGSSVLLGEKRPGRYLCACCGAHLFDADAKFDSGSGWPSFRAPHRPEVVAEREDQSHGMHRIEILCTRCRAHLGHVFPDGPAPSGLRYCINGLALTFEPEEAQGPMSRLPRVQVIPTADEHLYQVIVHARSGPRRHRVFVPPDALLRYGKGASPTALLTATFAFLLEREPPESILPEFSIEEVERYFPEFPRVVGSAAKTP